jgi:MFS family permease
VCAGSYAFITNYKIMLAVVIVHGLFWSALLSASGAYMAATIPEARRAEGLSYWGLASVLSVATAPALGFWVYRHGWGVLCAELAGLNLLMTVIAWRLPDDRQHDAHHAAATTHRKSGLIEWQVLLLSIAMSLVAFGYGGLTSFSALFADELHVTPRSLFLSVMASAILVGRLTVGRRIDQVGHRRVLLPSFAAPAIGLALLAVAYNRLTLIIAAIAFGSGFGLMYPSYTAYVIGHVGMRRRGAAFGAMLAAFDTGVGTGSTALGWLIHRFGFRQAYFFAAAIALLALPYFMFAERRLGFRSEKL